MATPQPKAKRTKHSPDSLAIPKPGMHLYVPGATSKDEDQLPTHIGPPTATSAETHTQTGAQVLVGPAKSELSEGGDAVGETQPDTSAAPQVVQQPVPATGTGSNATTLAQTVASAVLAIPGVRRLYRPRFLPLPMSQGEDGGDYVHLDASRSRCQIRLGIQAHYPVRQILTEVAAAARSQLAADGWAEPFVEATAVVCEEP